VRLELIAHPAAAAAGRVAVELVAQQNILRVEYEIESVDAIILPSRRAAVVQRCDELWRHTCCELFAAPAALVATAQGGAYREFNFSPCGDWAAYAFDSPRCGMRSLALDEAPRVKQSARTAATPIGEPSGPALALSVEVELPRSAVADYPFLWPTVVIETTLGISYWALRHHGPQADFHQVENFLTAVGVI